MGKISQLRDAITARGGTWMKAWKEDELQDALDELPEVALPSRRAAADDGEKKRRSGEVEQPLETSSAKKQKQPPPLLATKPHVNEPSEELLKACEAVLANHGKPPREEGDRITSAAVHKIIKSNYTLRGREGYGFGHALGHATRALAKRYEDLKPDEKKTSPLRWLDASAQIKHGTQRPEIVAARKKEVAALAPDVAKAEGEGRFAQIKHAMGTTKGVALPGTTIGLHAESKVGNRLRDATVGDALR